MGGMRALGEIRGKRAFRLLASAPSRLTMGLNQEEEKADRWIAQ